MAKSSSPLRWIITLVLLAAAGGGFFWWRGSDAPPQVTTAVIARGDVIQAVTATGDLQPVLNVNVSSQVSGIVSKLYVDWNTPVKKGQVLLEIDPANYQTALAQAKAQLTNQQANFNLVKLNTERTRELFKRNLVSQSDLDTAEAQFAQAEAQVEIQTANVQTAQVNLDRCTIYSPTDGTVISRQVDLGNTVAASLSAPTLFQIAADLKKMQINADVSEADIGTVAEGQDVNFLVDAYPNVQFRGKVSQIRNSPQTQQNVVVYSVMVDVNNDDLKLKPGMTATSAIVVASRTATLKVLNSALRVRLPDSLLPAPAPKGPDTGNVTAAGVQRTEAAPRGAPGGAGTPAGAAAGRGGPVRALLTELGIDPRAGPVSPDALARLQQLAKERGIELPERYSADRSSTTVTRTLYKVSGPTDHLVFTPVSVKLGITDGVSTEVIDGLQDGDSVVTSVVLPSSAPASGPVNNPFGGGGGGGGGRGGGGGGGRGF